jgi:hypothetical protein
MQRANETKVKLFILINSHIIIEVNTSKKILNVSNVIKEDI